MKKVNLHLLIILFSFLLLSINLCSQTLIPFEKIINVAQKANTVLLTSSKGQFLKISVELDDIIRVQASGTAIFSPSLLIERGFVRDDFSKPPFLVKDSPDKIMLTTKKLNVEISKSPFSIRLLNKNGDLLTQLAASNGLSIGANGNELQFLMPTNEHFYGFGFMRATFDARGTKLTWKKAYRWKEATVPFFMSTRNYGFYSNNTWNHTFDFTALNTGNNITEKYTIANAGGALDFYLFVGDNLKQILQSYTTLTGKPQMVPNWAIGVQYRCRYMETQENVLKLAKTFREKDIPVEVMALEPGWENEPYSDKLIWSKDRFPDAKGMIKDLNKMGFHFDLWESGEAPFKNILDSAVLKKWYQKKFHLLDMGVESFKQDDPYPRGISSQAYDTAVSNGNYVSSGKYSHPELINIVNSIFTETAFNEYRKKTAKRAVIQFHAYNATVASHRWPYQWGGDFLSGTGMLNAGLSGHAIASEDMRDFSPKGSHYSFFTPAPVLNAWAYYREPWSFSQAVEVSQRFYIRLRQKLAPYFYTTLWQSHTQALPMMRAMVLEYPTDTNTYDMKNQFMLGDWILVIAEPSKIDEFDRTQFVSKDLSATCYLPKGKWINYWTGESYNMESGRNVKITWPSYAGGALLVKGGAIIPTASVMKYTNERPQQVINLEIYPHQKSSYTLHEDDGISYKYENGEFVETTFRCKKNENSIVITSGGRKGKYAGMPTSRYYLLKVFSELPPTQIKSNGIILKNINSKDTLLYANKSGWYYDKEEKKIYIKSIDSWKLLKNKNRGERNSSLNFELDDVEAIEKPGANGSKLDVKIQLDTRPAVQIDFETGNMLADGISKNILHISPLHCTAENNSKPIFLIFKLHGPSHFLNGLKTMSIKQDELPLDIPVYLEKEMGIVKVICADNVLCNQIEMICSGTVDKAVVSLLNDIFISDGISVNRFKVELVDKKNNTSAILNRKANVFIKGSGSIVKGQDTISIKNGIGYFDVQSTVVAGIVSAQVKVDDIISNAMEVQSSKAQLTIKTNPEEEVLFPRGGFVDWSKPRVDVFVHFEKDGKIIHSMSPRDVVLRVYDSNRKLLKEYTAKANNGEAIFNGIDYYERPGKCYFVAISKGYNDVEIKIFENTWNYKLINNKLVK
jgi:alpha-glucosidase (family GH31 glycosyl hydrolase)